MALSKVPFLLPHRLHLMNYGADKDLYTSKLTNIEREKILKIVNDSNADQLSKYSISPAHIKGLSAYKSEKGAFKSVNDILEIHGLGLKAFEKICTNIIQDRINLVSSKTVSGSANKRLKNLLMPLIPENELTNITSAVGLHLGPTGASWAKLSKNQNRLEKWSYQSFMFLPPKMLPTDTYDLALSVLNQIPVGDVYIFELWRKSTKNQSTVATQHLELASMLLALLNTSPIHNLNSRSEIDKDMDTPKVIFPNVVHCVKYNLPARLFKTLIGHERVSTINVITELLNSSAFSIDCQLPCSKISLDTTLIDEYNSMSPPEKELLGQALMLAITFMDIWVYQNIANLTELTRDSKKNNS